MLKERQRGGILSLVHVNLPYELVVPRQEIRGEVGMAFGHITSDSPCDLQSIRHVAKL